MSCNAAAQGSEKKAAKLPFWRWSRSAGCWRVWVRVLVVLGAKLRSFGRRKADALRWRCTGCCGCLSREPSCGPRCPQRSRRHTGDASPGPSGATKKGPRRNAATGQPQATTDGVAAETAPLLPAPRECERTAGLHALRRAAAAARLRAPVLRKARDRLPPERDADAHGLGLLAAPSAGFPADERATTPTAPVAFRSRERRAAAAPRRGRAKRGPGPAGLGRRGSLTK